MVRSLATVGVTAIDLAATAVVAFILQEGWIKTSNDHTVLTACAMGRNNFVVVHRVLVPAQSCRRTPEMASALCHSETASQARVRRPTGSSDTEAPLICCR